MEARRLTFVTAYDFTYVPGAVLSIMDPGITRPDAAIYIKTSNPLHPGSGHDCDHGTSIIERRQTLSRRSSDEEPLGHIISQALGRLVVVLLVLFLILIVKESRETPPPLFR